MAKIRVYELARELSQDNKSLEEVVRGLGIPIKNYMSTLSPDEAQRVRAAVAGGGSRTKAERPPAPPPNRSGAPTGGGGPAGAGGPPSASSNGGGGSGSGGGGGGGSGGGSGKRGPAKTAIIRRGADVVQRRRAEQAERDVPPVQESRPVRQPAPQQPNAGGGSRPQGGGPTRTGPTSRPGSGGGASAKPRDQAHGPAASSAGGQSSGSVPSGGAEPPSPEGDAAGDRRSPAVGTRIALPPNTRRLAGGMASRMDQPDQPPPRASVQERASQERASQGRTSQERTSQERASQERTSESRPPRAPRVEVARPASPSRAKPATEVAPPPTPVVVAKSGSGPAEPPQARQEVLEEVPAGTADGEGEKDAAGRRVVRNQDGVIVGVASKRSGPNIKGFIQLAPPKRRQQVIITDATEEEKKGRASQRKQREERAQAQGRRKKPLRRGGKGPGGSSPRVSTIAMSDEKKRIRVDEAIQVSDLAHQMGQKASNLLRTLWGMGMRGITINNAVDFETAEMVAAEFGYTVENVAFQEDDLIISDSEALEELRAPVVTIMGHVDHGKTSLLDFIRRTRVASSEAGGITQHIGAYKVDTNAGPVVFLDTPGHEAFALMRQRGAQITDIVVLVVAADDGVMPTTIEAIKHARDAGSPIVVAINKIDKPDANPGRVKQGLMEHGIVGEEFGGDTPIIELSAKTGAGVETLLETLALQAEVLELTAPADGRAVGVVLEARIDKGRGTVATVLVQAGTLKRGDMLVANEYHGKVRGLFDPAGRQLEEVGPSTPVEVLGLSGVPDAGDVVNVVESDRDAKTLVAHRRELRRRKESVRTGPSIHEMLKRKKTPVLKVVLRADVQGSAQALSHALEELSTEKVKVEVIKAEVGQINETDVKYARAGDAVIFGFNVKTTGKAAPVADAEGVPIHTFSVIYEATEKAKELMVGLLEPEYREREQGEAEIRALFPIPRLGVVAGCRVTKGTIQRTSHVRVVRAGDVLFDGVISSLRVHKDDVREVKDGFECGIVVEGFPGIREGDVIQAYDVEAIPPTL